LQFLHAAKLGRIETRNPFDRIIAAPIRDERRQSGRAKSGGPASLGRRGRAVTIVREVSTALVCAAVVRIIMVKTVAGKGCCSARLTWITASIPSPPGSPRFLARARWDELLQALLQMVFAGLHRGIAPYAPRPAPSVSLSVSGRDLEQMEQL